MTGNFPLTTGFHSGIRNPKFQIFLRLKIIYQCWPGLERGELKLGCCKYAPRSVVYLDPVALWLGQSPMASHEGSSCGITLCGSC